MEATGKFRSIQTEISLMSQIQREHLKQIDIQYSVLFQAYLLLRKLHENWKKVRLVWYITKNRATFNQGIVIRAHIIYIYPVNYNNFANVIAMRYIPYKMNRDHKYDVSMVLLIIIANSMVRNISDNNNFPNTST